MNSTLEAKVMRQTDVIHWKLNEVMARKRIRNKDLAEALDITENSVYRLRKADEMPRLTPDRLNGICTALACQPGDLLEWISDDGAELEPLPHEVMRKLARYCDRILALSWKGYRHYGPGAAVYTDMDDGPEIAYIERDRLSDPDCVAAINNNRPELSAIVLYYDGNDYDNSSYTICTLTGPKSPPECYALLDME